MPKVIGRAAPAALIAAGALLGVGPAAPQGGQGIVTPATIEKLTGEISTKYGESERPRIEKGIRQAAEFWRKEDGDEAAFGAVVRAQICADSTARNELFSRMEFALESLNGHMNEISRDFRRQSDLDLGEIYPFDEILAGYDPSAHVVDDFFANRLAFVVLLNFPLTTLEERLERGRALDAAAVGGGASRRALRRRASRPTSTQAIARGLRGRRALHRRLQHLDAPPRRREGRRACSRRGMRLLSHWNLRDEIKADYADGKAGLAKQRIDRQGHGAHRHADDPGGGRRQPARRLEPGRRTRSRRRRSATRSTGGRPKHAGDGRASRTRATRRSSPTSRPRAQADPYSPDGADA